ncbi:MAG: SDR family oxidoreductase [Ignavibacteriaceae bacterium]
MKVLFIGGTGNISKSVSKLCAEEGIDLYLLNRGRTGVEIPGTKSIKADISNIKEVSSALKKHNWDVVVNWIVFAEKEIRRDIELFRNKTKQYIFISSASVYQKPPLHPVITESTPLYNPYWQYSRDKIACEELLNSAYREIDFPITIVRPSHTYDIFIPVAVGGWNRYAVIDRMKKGKKVIVHGDGTSLWVLTHSQDFAKAFVGLLGNQQAIGNAFHITSDEVLTWNQIYTTIARAIGVEPDLVHIPSEFLESVEESLVGNLLGDKAHSVIFDNSKIKSLVPGFTATIPFNKGIKKTLDWFDEDPKRKVVSDEADNRFEKIINAYKGNL